MELGERIPMCFLDEGAPYFVGSMGKQAFEKFLIDTGAQGNSLEASLFGDLHERKLIELGRSFASETVAGELRGERGGIKPRDVLVRVDDQPAAEIDPFALRQILTSAGGRTVPLTVRREKRELDLNVVLEED
jgi:hypothetical protein